MTDNTEGRRVDWWLVVTIAIVIPTFSAGMWILLTAANACG